MTKELSFGSVFFCYLPVDFSRFAYIVKKCAGKQQVFIKQCRVPIGVKGCLCHNADGVFQQAPDVIMMDRDAAWRCQEEFHEALIIEELTSQPFTVLIFDEFYRFQQSCVP